MPLFAPQAGLKHVLNLQWISATDILVDAEQLELTFIYEDQEKKTAGKIRAETEQELKEVEKVLKNSIQGSRVLKLPTRPSHKTMSIYISRDASDDVMLIKLIESVTRLDEFLWLRNNAHTLLKRTGYLIDNQGLIDRCLRPCFLLTRRTDVPEYADTRFCDSITFLESELLNWVEALEVQKLMPLADSIRKLAHYYARTREEYRQIGYSAASAPPNTLTLASHVASPRTIESGTLQALLTGPKEGQGLAHVTKKYGVYWKQNPSHPGVEYATDTFSALVATRATCAACLVKFSYFDDNQKARSQLVLASKAVFGKTLRETLQSSPEDLDTIDMESFSEIFIISLLTCPQDWKSDNLIVSKQDGRTTIVGIDNDHSFADTVVSAGGDNNPKHIINVKNIIFCLPQCDQPISPATRQKFLNLDPLLLLAKWVQSLTKQNTLYQSLLDAKFLSILDLKQLNLPIRLRNGTLLEAYRVLTSLQSILRSSEVVSLNYLFQSVYPVLFQYYQHFNSKRAPETNLETHFNQTIWAMPAFETIPELIKTPIRYKGNDVLIKDALNDYVNKTFDMFKGDRMPIEELETLLREVDWSLSSVQAQTDLIEVLKKLVFMNLTVIGSSELSGGDVAAIIENSPGMLQIQLVRCPKMSKEALKQALLRNRAIAVYVSGCTITQAEVQELSKQGYHISYVEAADDASVVDARAGSMALEAPMLFHAIESIRYGRFEEAYQFLSQPNALLVHILAKYKDRLLQNISLPDLMRCKHANLLELLVRTFGFNINEPTVTGHRPWHYVTQSGDVIWAKAVAAICPTLAINCQNADLETCLHLAVSEGDLPMLAYLLEELKCDPSICDSKMRTPLTSVMRLGSLSAEVKTSMSKLLIDCSRDLNMWQDNAGNGFLHIALRNRLLTVAARLVSSGINVNAENALGETPLHIACLHRCRDISSSGVFRNLVTVLVQAGANIMARTKAGRTAMHYAVRGGSRTIISTLANRSVDLVTSADNAGFTPLHASVELISSSTSNSLRELLESKYPVDLNAKSALGVTPLILAAQKANWLAIELLCVNEVVQVDLQDSAQNTALFYAVTRTCLPAVQILVQKRGSNPNKGNGATSPMWRAVMVLYKDLLLAQGPPDAGQRASVAPSSSGAVPAWLPPPIVAGGGASSPSPGSLASAVTPPPTSASPSSVVTRSTSPLVPRHGPLSSPASSLQGGAPTSGDGALPSSPPPSLGKLTAVIPQSASIGSPLSPTSSPLSPMPSASASGAPGTWKAGATAHMSVRLASAFGTNAATATATPSAPESSSSELIVGRATPSPPLSQGPTTTPTTTNVVDSAVPYTGGPLVPATLLFGIRHDIAASLFHYGGDMESPNLQGSYLIHEIATRALKDGTGSTGPAELEFMHTNAPHAVQRLNKSDESFLHILAKFVVVGSPPALTTTILKLWKRYINIVGTLSPAFCEKETADGSTLIHILVQTSNDLLLQDLANGSSNVLSALKFPFEGTKAGRKHPIMCALAIGNLSVCSLLFEHLGFPFSKSEWKQVTALAMKVGCLEMSKNAQTRCQAAKS